MKQLLELFVLGYAGMVLHVLNKLRSEIKKTGFTMGGFIKDQAITIMSTIIAVPLSIYLIKDNPALQEQIPLTSLTAVGIGYVGQSVLLSFLGDKFKEKSNAKNRPTSDDVADPSI